MARKRKLTVEELVRKRVDEIMSSKNLGRFLEPDFRSRVLHRGVTARQTVWDRRKHGLYFQKWGCRVCGRKDVAHGANGHCDTCFVRLNQRYAQLQKEWEADHPVQEMNLDPKSETAKRLLGGLGER